MYIYQHIYIYVDDILESTHQTQLNRIKLQYAQVVYAEFSDLMIHIKLLCLD